MYSKNLPNIILYLLLLVTTTVYFILSWQESGDMDIWGSAVIFLIASLGVYVHSRELRRDIKNRGKEPESNRHSINLPIILLYTLILVASIVSLIDSWIKEGEISFWRSVTVVIIAVWGIMSICEVVKKRKGAKKFT